MPLSTPYAMPSAAAGNLRERVLRSDFFTMERWTLSEPEPFEQDGRSFRILFALDGDLAVSSAGGAATVVPAGRSALLPAAMGPCTVGPAASGGSVRTLGIGL